ncbi:hypothetical protein AB0H71_12320 [Nocardia sp. NPDC050697]|uniref:WXG100-like domain-containing protein n=1 Tax=Nocardia sp. NPDC050697 TaxID=3155158 RepID=UPI0033F33304
MALYLPPYLEWLEWVAGSDWPHGNEDSMWEMSRELRAIGADVERLLGDLETATRTTLAVYPAGEGREKMADFLGQLRSGDGSLQKLAENFTALADSADQMGDQLQAAKLNVIAGLVLLAAELAYALFLGPGAPFAQAGAIAAAQFAFRWLGMRLLGYIERMVGRLIANQVARTITTRLVYEITQEAIVEALQGAAQELSVQAIQISGGHKDGFDWGQVGLNTGISAIAGGAGGAGGNLLHHALPGTLPGVFRGALTGAGAGAVGAGAAYVATGVFTNNWEFDPRMLTGGVIGGIGPSAVYGARGTSDLAGGPMPIGAGVDGGGVAPVTAPGAPGSGDGSTSAPGDSPPGTSPAAGQTPAAVAPGAESSSPGGSSEAQAPGAGGGSRGDRGDVDAESEAGPAQGSGAAGTDSGARQDGAAATEGDSGTRAADGASGARPDGAADPGARAADGGGAARHDGGVDASAPGADNGAARHDGGADASAPGADNGAARQDGAAESGRDPGARAAEGDSGGRGDDGTQPVRTDSTGSSGREGSSSPTAPGTPAAAASGPAAGAGPALGTTASTGPATGATAPGSSATGATPGGTSATGSSPTGATASAGTTNNSGSPAGATAGSATGSTSGTSSNPANPQGAPRGTAAPSGDTRTPHAGTAGLPGDTRAPDRGAGLPDPPHSRAGTAPGPLPTTPIDAASTGQEATQQDRQQTSPAVVAPIPVPVPDTPAARPRTTTTAGTGDGSVTRPAPGPAPPAHTPGDCGPRALGVAATRTPPGTVTVPDEPGARGITAETMEEHAGTRLREAPSHDRVIADLLALGDGATVVVVDEYPGPADSYDVGAHAYTLTVDGGVVTVHDDALPGGSLPLSEWTAARPVSRILTLSYDADGTPLHPVATHPHEVGPMARIGEPPPATGVVEAVGEAHGSARVGAQLTEADILAQVLPDLRLVTPGDMIWNRTTGVFELPGAEPRRTVRLLPGPVPENHLATYAARRDGSGYDVTLSTGTRDADVTRVVANVLAEIQLTERGSGPSAAGRFAQLRVLATEVDRARTDPTRAEQLAPRRAALAELTEQLRGALHEAGPELAQRIRLEQQDALGARPEISRTLTDAGFDAATAEHLARLEQHLVGEHAGALRAAEQLGLAGRMHEELARRIFDPVFEPAAAAAGKPVRAALNPLLTPITQAINAPDLTPARRAAALHTAIDALANLAAATPALHAALDIEAMHRAADAFAAAPTRIGAVLDHSTGTVRLDQELPGLPRDSEVPATALLRLIDEANRGAVANGIDMDYVLVIHDRVGDHSTLQLLSRPQPQHRLPLEQNLRHTDGVPFERRPAAAARAAAAGAHTVDVGVGRSAFAAELLPDADRAGGGLVLQTELTSDYSDAGQRRRDLGVLDPGALPIPGAVTIYGDLLGAGGFLNAGGNGGIGRVVVNNVSAHLDEAAYDTLARSLPRSLAPGARIEVQWDMKTQETDGTGHPGDRGHIQADLLLEAIRRVHPPAVADAFRIVESEVFTPPGNEDYPYSIDAGKRNVLDLQAIARVAPPIPDHRAVIVYEPGTHRITDAALPGSDRSVVYGPFPADHLGTLHEQLPSVVERAVRGHGDLALEAAGPDRYRVTDAHGAFEIRVETARLGSATAAQAHVHLRRGEYLAQVDERLRPDQLERSFARVLGEIVEYRHRFIAGEAVQHTHGGVLRPGPAAPGAVPTANDLGRVQELRVLAEQADWAGADRWEAVLLVEALGLREGTPGAGPRRQIVLDHLTGAGRARVELLLADVARAEAQLPRADRQLVAEARAGIRTAAALDFLTLRSHVATTRAHVIFRNQAAAAGTDIDLVEEGGARWYRWPPHAEISPAAAPPPIGLPVAPEALHERWSQLSRAERNAWYRADPYLGNRDGIPHADRDHYNRQTLAALRAEAEARLAEAGQDAAEQIAARLSVIRDMLTLLDAPQRNRPPYLLSYLDADLRYIYALGDPDTAQNVVVELAGAFRRRSGVGYATQTLAQIRQAALAVDPEATTSTLLFGAYDNPNSLATALLSVPAEEGAPTIRRFHDGLRATHRGAPPHITTIAHSYGGVAGGHAAGHGHALNTDALVFIGSWGTGVPHVSDLRLTGVDPADIGKHVFATMARYDSILLMPGTHGPPPAGPAFGATVFESASRPSNTLRGWNPDDHTAPNYLDSTHPSYTALGLIITGRGHLLR